MPVAKDQLRRGFDDFSDEHPPTHDEMLAGLLATSTAAVQPPRQVGTSIPELSDRWVAGMVQLQRQPPLPGFSDGRWRQLCRDCAALLDQHGAEMRHLGWSATDAFGVHPDRPADAVHCAGLAVLLNGSEVVSVSATGAVIRSRGDATQSFTRMPMPEAVPVWAVER